jgi:hypothetical protein
MTNKPKHKPIPNEEIIEDDDDESLYTSSNGDTIQERYRKVTEREANMTEEERIKALREGAERFRALYPDFYDEEDEDAED